MVYTYFWNILTFMTYRHRILALVFCASIACSTLLSPAPAHALTLSPIKVELSANPGEVVRIPFEAFNDDTESKLYYLDYQAFDAKDESGNPILTRSKTGIPTWFTGPSTVTLGPKERRKLEVEMQIPANAEPGGHFGAILLRNDPPKLIENDSVTIGSQVGLLVLLRVSGQFTEGADILEFGVTRPGGLLKSLPVDFYYRFQNNGDDWVKPLGDIVIESIWGRTKKIIPANPSGGNTLPRSIRKYEASWITRSGETQDQNDPRPPGMPEGFWNKVVYEAKYSPIGRFSANLTLTYGGQNQLRSKATVHFWIIPWELLVVAIPSILLTLWLLRFSIRRYNRYVIRKARKK